MAARFRTRREGQAEHCEQGEEGGQGADPVGGGGRGGRKQQGQQHHRAHFGQGSGCHDQLTEGAPLLAGVFEQGQEEAGGGGDQYDHQEDRFGAQAERR